MTSRSRRLFERRPVGRKHADTAAAPSVRGFLNAACPLQCSGTVLLSAVRPPSLPFASSPAGCSLDPAGQEIGPKSRSQAVDMMNSWQFLDFTKPSMCDALQKVSCSSSEAAICAYTDTNALQLPIMMQQCTYPSARCLSQCSVEELGMSIDEDYFLLHYLAPQSKLHCEHDLGP